MWKKFDKHSQIYRTESKIENFKFSITLKSIDSLLKIPKFDRNAISALTIRGIGEDNDFSSQQTFNKTESDFDDNNQEDFFNEITIKWQEKILSPHEKEYYKDIENCTTETHKRYHQWIQENRFSASDSENENEDEETGKKKKKKVSKGKFHRSRRNKSRKTNRIFTYVNDDYFVLKEEILKGINLPISSIAAQPGGAERYGRGTITRLQEVNNRDLFDPLVFDDNKMETMYVFADLNPDTLLFMAKWSENERILIVYPNFNDFHQNPYYIEIDTDYRHLYSYGIKNQSKSIFTNASSDYLKFPIADISPYPPTSSSILLRMNENILRESFDMPPKRSIRFILFMEIKEAQGFEYDNVHIRYYFEFPQYVQVEMDDADECCNHENYDVNREKIEYFINKDGLLCGCTHSSVRRRQTFTESSDITGLQSGSTWNFNHCIELNLICQDIFKFQDSIKVYLEVISIDGWERERSEGFSTFQIPIRATGNVHHDLPCYRFDYGFWDKIRRYFIGGRRKFDFCRFNLYRRNQHGKNNNNNNNVADDEAEMDEERKENEIEDFLNRYGNQVITTGKIHVDFSAILQRNHELISRGGYEKTSRKKHGMTLDDIMKAYQEARKRLEATT